MNRKLPLAFLSLWGVLVAATAASAEVKTIVAHGNFMWDLVNTPAKVGDEIEWIIGNDSAGAAHGVQIFDWDVLTKGNEKYVEYIPQAGQWPFDPSTGQSVDPKGTDKAGMVLLHLKINKKPPGEIINFQCTVHGPFGMTGTVYFGQPPAMARSACCCSNARTSAKRPMTGQGGTGSMGMMCPMMGQGGMGGMGQMGMMCPMMGGGGTASRGTGQTGTGQGTRQGMTPQQMQMMLQMMQQMMRQGQSSKKEDTSQEMTPQQMQMMLQMMQQMMRQGQSSKNRD